MLYYIVIYYIIQLYTILYYAKLYYNILYFTVLYSNILYYTTLYYIIICHTILYNILYIWLWIGPNKVVLSLVIDQRETIPLSSPLSLYPQPAPVVVPCVHHPALPMYAVPSNTM